MTRRTAYASARISFLSALVCGLLGAVPLLGAEFTFFSCSDTHYEETAEQNADRFAGVALINDLPGTPYPKELGGGTVDQPLGVLVLGDLIDDGAAPAKSDKQFEFWLRDFGVNGEGNLKFPVYEGLGNHDLSPTRFVQRAIIQRNKRRPGLSAVSDNGLHYSWDWQGVHFVQLNLYPGDAWQEESRYGPAHNPEGALEFLTEDLRDQVGDSGRPVVLAHHYDPRDDWWLDREKAAYYAAIKDYNILCLIHGHTGTGIYQWNGLDVVNDGSLPWGGVFVFRITDDDRLYVGQYTPEKEWRLTFSKRVEWNAATEDKSESPAPQAELDGPADEVSFLVVSDTHYRTDDLAPNHDTVLGMNRIAGLPQPEAIGGGVVWRPRGVLHAGDATNDAKAWQWQAFIDDYGVDGEGSLRYPVYETYGNHDGGLDSPVGQGIVQRNRKRPGVCAVSENGLHYHWQWEDVHFLCLGVRPGRDVTPYHPHHSLEFLRCKLETRVGDAGAPVVLYHHFGFDAAHSLNWWTDREREEYYNLIRDYNVVAIFHGHNHECEFYRWRGIDVFNAPHMQWNPASLGFFVAHITPRMFRVAERRADDTWGRTFRKSIWSSYEAGGVAVVVNNGDGPRDIKPAAATLRADVVYLDADVEPAEMHIYWGEQDGGENAEQWAHRGTARKSESGEYRLAVGELLADTVYHYRAAMDTSAGSDWADFSWKFQTPPAAVVSNGEPLDVQMDEAVLTGRLESAFAPTEILLYWGRTDGGTDAAAWEHVASLDARKTGAFRNVVENLAPATRYYYRAKAVNIHGHAWAERSSSFTTLPAVAVNNSTGATEIRQRSAVLQGELTMANARLTRATIYWGQTDGGTDPEAWQHAIDLGPSVVGTLRAPIENLRPATVYYYRAFAENPSGAAWTASSERFATARDFSDWRRRAKIQFSGYEGRAALKDFPALVVLDENIEGFGYADFASGDGSDLRFSDAHGSELAHEVESWDPAGSSYIWVRVPLLNGPDTVIRAYWGNPDQGQESKPNPAGSVWAAGFAGVWHMDDPDARDALGRNHGKGRGNVSTPGVVSTAQHFPAEGNSVLEVRPVTENLMLDGPLSISAWVKPLGPKGYLGIVTKGEGWGECNLHLKAGSRRATLELKPFLPDAATAPVGRTQLGTGVWHHVAGTWDGIHARVFVNGQEDACSEGRGTTDSRSPLLRFGQIETRHAPCALDEVRISATPRPADWVRASWKNQSAPTGFCEISVD